MTSVGLTSDQVRAYQRAHGYNEIVERRQPFWVKLAKRFVSPISLMLLAAALLSFVGRNVFDGTFILILLVMNIGIMLVQEHKADSAIAALNRNLATMVRTMRDGSWREVPARELVPGDLIDLKAGNLVPADAQLEEANHVSVNEAALTGESLPKEKRAGDRLYSGSFLAAGLATARVTAIGNKTSFGSVVTKLDVGRKRSGLERDILRISRFLSIASVIAVCIMTGVLLISHTPWLDILRLDLSLVIAGIPVSLPTVMTFIIAYGVVALAKKQVIVRRLAALEELANTDLLLTDKTGTLTKNLITVHDVLPYGDFTDDEIRRLAGRVATKQPAETMNRALVGFAPTAAADDVVAYIPGDSTRKRSTLTIKDHGTVRTLSLGAPQTIAALCVLTEKTRAAFTADVAALAARGYRTIALAVVDGNDETRMTLAGLIALSDELRPDAGEVVRFLTDNGIAVAMVTGDDRAIAGEIAHTLDLPGRRVIAREELAATGWDAITPETYRETQAFAEILPEDKYELVKRAKRFYTVAANGDGVNDLPAVRAANVGFAVANAVDALKGAADIVLLTDGIGVIRDAFFEGRKIFERLYTYSLYRISESFRLIITIVILGLTMGTYPLTPLQLILIVFLNDIPIISLATDRVRVANHPSRIPARERFFQSVAYGLTGVVNSILLFFLATSWLHLPFPVVETMFFLKLTVSGHLLVFVVHTKERWWRYLPSRAVMIATGTTQAIATVLAITGFLMPAAISWQLALFVWVWSFIIMQLSEAVKYRRWNQRIKTNI
jgi:H+-transporting ATPase